MYAKSSRSRWRLRSSFAQDQVVRVKREQVDVLTRARKYFGQTLLVILRGRRDRHDIEIHAVLLVKVRISAGERNEQRL